MPIGISTSSFNQLGGDIDGEATNGQSGFSQPVFFGQVRVFCCDGVTSRWSQHGSATSGENHVDFLDPSVDLSGNGNILAVGATSGKNAKVFQWKEDSGKWEPIAEALPGGGDEILIGKNWLAIFPVLLSGNGRTLAAEDPLLRFWSKHTITSHLRASFSTHTFEKNNNV
eukprot:scaffold5321_cov126-Cylindrotheca_fusiformis.AAC.2